MQKEQTYHVGTGSLAWYLDSQESILPGANGKLEFYIIPKKDNVKSVTQIRQVTVIMPESIHLSIVKEQ